MKRRSVYLLAGVVALVLVMTLGRQFGEWRRDQVEEQAGDGGGPVHWPSTIVADHIRLATHRFVPVGTSLDVTSLGELLEVGAVGPSAMLEAREEGSVTCAEGGVGFVRAQYRADDAPKNRIQTLVVTCVDETGSCDGATPLAADLEAHLVREPRGEANLLAQGSQGLYGVCDVAGRVRLQTAVDMPPLMLRIIDAFADGVYSLGDAEFDLVRRSAFTTYSGDVLEPPWMTQNQAELNRLELGADGTVEIEYNACDRTPACTTNASLARPGDLVALGFGVPNNTGLDFLFETTTPDVLAAFVEAHVPIDWAATSDLEENTRKNIVFRLVGLEVMDRVMEDFDGHFGLREHGIRVGYDPYWQTRYRIPPGCASDQQARCVAIDDALDAYERERVEAWREEGYRLWFAGSAPSNDQGQYTGLQTIAPSLDMFDGAAVYLGAARPVPANESRGDVMARVMAGVAREVGDLPVIIDAHSSAMRFSLDGTLCEGEVCVSALTDLYQAYEAAITVMRTDFKPGQVQALALSTIDGGSHFDVREPYEERSGLWLNRVGETGYNNPLLNLYVAR